MSLRRLVALVLLVSVSASSAEVLFGLESSLADAEVHVVVAATQPEAGPASSEDAGEDCACLCACFCSNAQMVVGPADAPSLMTQDVAEPSRTRDHQSPTFPFPRPPHRPPLG